MGRAWRIWGTMKLCDATILDTCHYTFVQTHRMYNTKSELQCFKLWALRDNDVSLQGRQL